MKENGSDTRVLNSTGMKQTEHSATGKRHFILLKKNKLLYLCKVSRIVTRNKINPIESMPNIRPL